MTCAGASSPSLDWSSTLAGWWPLLGRIALLFVFYSSYPPPFSAPSLFLSFLSAFVGVQYASKTIKYSLAVSTIDLQWRWPKFAFFSSRLDSSIIIATLHCYKTREITDLYFTRVVCSSIFTEWELFSLGKASSNFVLLDMANLLNKCRICLNLLIIVMIQWL